MHVLHDRSVVDHDEHIEVTEAKESKRKLEAQLARQHRMVEGVRVAKQEAEGPDPRWNGLVLKGKDGQ